MSGLSYQSLATRSLATPLQCPKRSQSFRYKARNSGQMGQNPISQNSTQFSQHLTLFVFTRPVYVMLHIYI